MTKTKGESTIGRRLLVVLVFASVIGVWWWFGVSHHRFPFATDDPATRGQPDDEFGAVNSLFSGLAFAGLLIALYIQNRDLAHAIEGQRDAASQQTKAITAQLFLQVTEDIRSVDWGKAHDHLRLYHESNRTEFHYDFSRRRDFPIGQEHDMHRRVFLEPCYKVWNLVKAKLVDDDAARVVLTPDLILTLLDVIEPLEEIIRSNYDRSMFAWARALYTEEDLKSRGAYIHAATAAVSLSVTGK